MNNGDKVDFSNGWWIDWEEGIYRGTHHRHKDWHLVSVDGELIEARSVRNPPPIQLDIHINLEVDSDFHIIKDGNCYVKYIKDNCCSEDVFNFHINGINETFSMDRLTEVMRESLRNNK